MRKLLMDNIGQNNTRIELGPAVTLDFSDVPDEALPLQFGRCVTLTSVDSFPPDDVILLRRAPGAATADLTSSLQHASARTPHSQGPELRFGPRRDNVHSFLDDACSPNDENPTAPTNDHVRISGFRLTGPSQGQQHQDDFGINIQRCIDVEISNMEISGWGGAGIMVNDVPGEDQAEGRNATGGRNFKPEHVRIFHNYFHNNQHPRTWFDSHTGGYGVEVHHGAWALIYENLFDQNRHGIAAAGDTGGYDAVRNLFLKGGGIHGVFWNPHTHITDVHGTGCWWSDNLCGDAGMRFLFLQNAYQYRSDAAIKIRGRPLSGAYIRENIFPHDGLEDDWGDDAVVLQTSRNITFGPGNRVKTDTFGEYGVCDFDGDGVDDLFLATGATWWFSSFGEFPWTYLSARGERLAQVRLGYFNADAICDVLAVDGDGAWVVSDSGVGPWRSIGAFGAPLSEVAFGRFDPNVRDHRPGATRQTTHAFRRMPDGEWRVTPLSAPDWQHAQSSARSMSDLRFGDFTGDGVTDVLSTNGGRWAISVSARSPWQRLNNSLGDDVTNLFIADLNNNNIDDILKLDRTPLQGGSGVVRLRLAWSVSEDGRGPWRSLRSYTLTMPAGVRAGYAFAGRFGAAPGGGVMIVDTDRRGRFFSPAETGAGAPPNWVSLHPY